MRTAVWYPYRMVLRKILSWMIVLCGLWEFGDVVAPFVPGFGNVQAFMWNHIIVGFIWVVVGAWAALTRNIRTTRTMNWIAVAGGVWLVAASFILDTPDNHIGLWNDVVVGTIVILLGIWAALATWRAAV